jgi:hypothetical protein
VAVVVIELVVEVQVVIGHLWLVKLQAGGLPLNLHHLLLQAKLIQ